VNDSNAAPSSKVTLADVLARTKQVQQDGRTPVFVFDLDHTLFDNGPRTWHILAELAEHTGRDGLRRQLDGLARTGLPYLLADTFARIGVDDEALHKEAFAFWKQRFFTDEYQRYDMPLPGAVDFAQRAFAAGGTLIYLSGRDAPGMLVGCATSLRQHGFPVGVARTSIVLKPDFETADIDFKREAIDWIDTLGHIVASFDNEPANCNLFAERWPAAATYFVDTAFAPDPPALNLGVETISDFVVG
jgi:hypothetical protein